MNPTKEEYKDKRATELSLKVEAVNLVAKKMNELYPLLAEIIRPFLGQKVINADGSLVVKLKKLIPDFTGEQVNTFPAPRIDIARHGGGLRFGIRVETYGGDEHSSASDTLYVGNITGGVLESIYNPPARRADWTVVDVVEARAELKAAKEAVSRAQSKLYSFGEY